MGAVAIKCYLPGRRTQYVLNPSEDMVVELGTGADLCPRGFDDGTRLQFSLVGEQWFVAPQSGQLSHEDGRSIAGPTAIGLPATLVAGSATLVLTSLVDPRLPALVVDAPAGAPVGVSRQSMAATRSSAASSGPTRIDVRRSNRVSASSALTTAASRAVAPQPRRATLQPRVAAADAPVRLEAASVPNVGQSPRTQRDAGRSNETRILDMSQFGAANAGASPQAAPKPERISLGTRWARLQLSRRLLAYTMLGLVLVAVQFGIHRRAGRASPALLPVRALPETARATLHEPESDLAPLPRGVLVSQQRAGELYALGDYANALRQYRALAAQPESAPVFGVIAHALELRLRHPRVQR